ncbi:palmitoyltransferase ZDHHC19 [Ornithorhynchus anatinus]|uniref:palmitoyltransferase ZDHHC19 n=1 Tax=Ornithorhynchus anatinus TaxID=9258 RepID=UPI0010A7794B|nr:palmitoyltransferase ZDHHC19 [Ornithorhynchus anatinus]
MPPGTLPRPWALPSLFAAINVALLVSLSGLFFSFPCRWLAQQGHWVFPVLTGTLFVPTLVSLVLLNFSDPGTLHRGTEWQCPREVQVMWVNKTAFRLQWCSSCCYHRPPRTIHCPCCNICVEDFDHHCKWVNNCVGHRNFRCFLLLVSSLSLYTAAVLASCLAFFVYSYRQPFSVDKFCAVAVSIPAAIFLVPLVLLLAVQVLSVSAAERSFESKCRYLRNYNPFNQGCLLNWYLALCAPLGPKYMAEAVRLQGVLSPSWTWVPDRPWTRWHANLDAFPQPLWRLEREPLGRGEAAPQQEVSDVPPQPRETPRWGPTPIPNPHAGPMQGPQLGPVS